jgi:hypothetical protein
MESSPPQLDNPTPAPSSAMTLERRPDGLFVQIPPAPRERLLAKIDRSVFRRFMIFFFVSVVTGHMYFTNRIPGQAALIVLPVIVFLAILLYRALIKRSTMIRIAHLPTKIEVANGTLSIHAPHVPHGADLTVPVQRVRSLTVCPSGLDGFEIGLTSLSIHGGGGIRLTIELDDNKAHDVLVKCDLTANEVLLLETELRNTLGLPSLKPP